MHRSELNVLRLGAIVAIKRDTVLFFPKTGGGEELLLFVSNELSSRNFARDLIYCSGKYIFCNT